jgi:hypothetical protein
MLVEEYSHFYSILDSFTLPFEIEKGTSEVGETKSSIYQQFEKATHTTFEDLNSPVPRKSSNAQVIHKKKLENKNEKSHRKNKTFIDKKERVRHKKTKIEKEIAQSTVEVAQIRGDLNKIEKQIAHSSSVGSILSMVQFWIGDFILKGGSSISESILPLILNKTPDSLPGLRSSHEWIKMFTDIIDIGNGYVGLIYKHKILNAAYQEIIKLKLDSSKLQPDQLARLEQLEKVIKYKQSLLPLQDLEQHVKLGKKGFSIIPFILARLGKSPIFKVFSSAASTISEGFSVALSGIQLHRASHNLRIHRKWSKDFKDWIEKQTFCIASSDDQEVDPVKHYQEIAKQMKAKITQRQNRQLKQMKTLKEKLAQKEISIDQIKAKIKDFKSPALQQFVGSLNMQEITAEILQEKLEERLGIPLCPILVKSIYETQLSLIEVKKSDILPAEEKKIRIEKLNQLIVTDLNQCCETWLDHQSEDALLNIYIEFQSILEPVIKNALIDMIKKKQKIEKNFLKVKKIQSGIRFSTETLIFGASLILTIIGLTTTPFGGAGLILLLLGIGSFVISLGLFGGGCYFAYKKNPGLTTAKLKGAFFRLMIYHSLAKIHSIHTSIRDYLKKAMQEKREKLANHIAQLPFIHRFFEHGREKDEVELKEFVAKRKGIQLDFQEKRNKSQEWHAKAVALQTELEQIAWNDFAKQAHLPVAAKPTDQIQERENASFDTLEELNRALNQVDFNLMSSETKELFEKQLGINVHLLQAEAGKNPSQFKQSLRNFFNLNDSGYLKFIGEQKFMQKKTQ